MHIEKQKKSETTIYYGPHPALRYFETHQCLKEISKITPTGIKYKWVRKDSVIPRGWKE